MCEGAHWPFHLSQIFAGAPHSDGDPSEISHFLPDLVDYADLWNHFEIFDELLDAENGFVP